MKVRTKKMSDGRVVRIESGGEIKEIIINEDLLHQDEASVQLCFRGKNSSGIVELAPREVEALYKEFSSKKKLLKGVKIMKFDRE